MRGVTGIPQRLLGDDEHVVMALRPHWKELVWPTIVLLVVSPVASFSAAKMPDGHAQKWLRLAVLVIAVVIVLRWTLWPFLRWLTTSYVVTDRRIITRVGILARHGRDMPLSRVNDVSFDHSGILERVLGCGTLVVESAGERGQVTLTEVPRVEKVQRELYDLVENTDERRRGIPEA